MFSKLLKHEWKANAGLLGILSLCALGAGLLGGLTLRGILYMEAQSETMATLGVSGLSSAMVFIVLALVAYAFAVQFINLFRFYKNKFTDEGYLTFTLPVSARQIFLSSFLNMLAWLVISALVLIAAVALILFIGAFEELLEYAYELQPTFWGIFGLLEESGLNEPGGKLYCVLTAVTSVFTPVYYLLLLMTSITVGSVLAKKHKILATIGIYYCINFAVGMVESFLTVIPAVLMLGNYEDQIYVYMNCTAAISLTVQIALAIGGYFLSTHLMKHKLNLP